MEKHFIKKAQRLVKRNIHRYSKFVICPYGEMGRFVESLLLKSGICSSDIVIVDNGKSNKNSSFFSVESFSKLELAPQSSVVFLCSWNHYKELYSSLLKTSSQKNYINIFKDPPFFLRIMYFCKNLITDSLFTSVFVVILFFLKKIYRRFFYSSLNKKDIAVIMDGGRGDGIIASGATEVLKRNGCDVTLFVSSHCYDFYETARCNDNVYLVKYGKYTAAILDSKSKKIKVDLKFDTIVSFLDIPQHKILLLDICNKIHFKKLIGFNQIIPFSYDINCNYESEIGHISWQVQRVFSNISKTIAWPDSYPYYLDIPDECKRKAEELFNNINPSQKRIILINCSASSPDRSLSRETLVSIFLDLFYLKIDCKVVVINCNYNIEEFLGEDIVLAEFKTFDEVSHFISLVDLIITPDTSLVHVARAFNTHSICIYNNRLYNNKYSNNILFGPGPNYSNALQIYTDEYDYKESGDDIRYINYWTIHIALKKKLISF